MYTPTKARVVANGMAGSQRVVDCNGHTVRSRTGRSFGMSAAAASTESDGSASDDSLTSPRRSLPQLGCSYASGHPVTSLPMGRVHVQSPQAMQPVGLAWTKTYQ